MSLESYVDADFTNCIADRHSISRYAVCLAGGPICWKSKSLSTIALSIMEALWLRFLLEEMGNGTEYFHSDCTERGQQGVHKFSNHSGNHRNSKHIDYHHNFLPEGIQCGDNNMKYFETHDQIEDIITKAVNFATVLKFCYVLAVSGSKLILVVKKSKEPEEKRGIEPTEKKQKK